MAVRNGLEGCADMVQINMQTTVTDKDIHNYKIIAKGIGRDFLARRSGDKEFTAIDNFSIKVKQGEFLAIVGPSGCGKSTFLDILAGLSKPTRGKVYIDGREISGPALDRGIILQGYALFPWRTARKNIEYGLEIKRVPKAQRHQISQKFIDLVELNGFENNYPYELSGGMRQRVAIARALAYDPEVLLMDEPFAAVDAQTRETLQEELLSIWERTEKTIVFITHSIEEAVFLADRVAVMSANPGSIKAYVDITLPRPRLTRETRNSFDFPLLTDKVWKLLHNADTQKTEKAAGYLGVNSDAPLDSSNL